MSLMLPPLAARDTPTWFRARWPAGTRPRRRAGDGRQAREPVRVPVGGEQSPPVAGPGDHREPVHVRAEHVRQDQGVQPSVIRSARSSGGRSPPARPGALLSTACRASRHRLPFQRCCQVSPGRPASQPSRIRVPWVRLQWTCGPAFSGGRDNLVQDLARRCSRWRATCPAPALRGTSDSAPWTPRRTGRCAASCPALLSYSKTLTLAAHERPPNKMSREAGL